MVEAPVTSLTKFGAFVQLAEGVEGMIHIGDISAEASKGPGRFRRGGPASEVHGTDRRAQHGEAHRNTPALPSTYWLGSVLLPRG